MRIILGFIHIDYLSGKLRLALRLIGPLGLLIAAVIIDSSSASYQAAIDRNFTRIKKLTAPDGSKFIGSLVIDVYFGASVAIYGNTAIVGAINGAVYIFERNKGGANNWGEVKKLTASDGGVLKESYSVAIYEDTAIVGFDGSAYIFERNNGGANNWGEVKKLIAPDVKSYAEFGACVAIYKDTAIVGATVGEADKEKNGLGAAYVFERNKGGVNNWGKVKKLTGSDRSKDDGYDEFGDSVAIYGDTAIVGAGGFPVFKNNEGAAYIFERNKGGANNWGEVKKLTASDGAGRHVEGRAFAYRDGFGSSVAIYGNTAIVGANGDYDFTLHGRGAIYIFERGKGGTDNWKEVKKLKPSDSAIGDGFGDSVAIYADVAVVGAPGDPHALKNGKGTAYIIERNKGGANNWAEIKKLTASDSNGDKFDEFGCSVAIYGNTAMVGAPEADNGSDEGQRGGVYIFSSRTLRR